jgi:hypothetical protein
MLAPDKMGIRDPVATVLVRLSPPGLIGTVPIFAKRGTLATYDLLTLDRSKSKTCTRLLTAHCHRSRHGTANDSDTTTAHKPMLSRGSSRTSLDRLVDALSS